VTTTSPASGLLPTSLSTNQADMVASCYQHRLLSTTQLAALHTPGSHVRCAQRPLVGLEQLGWLGRVRGRPPGRQSLWFVTAAAAAIEGGDATVRPYRMTPLQATGTLQSHTLDVNEVGVSFVTAARRHGHDFTPRDWHHEIAHRTTDRAGAGRRSNLVVDALLTCTIWEEGQEAVVQRFLELDRATENVATLISKLRAYAALHAYEPKDPSHRWKARYLSFPKVLLVLAGRPEPDLDRRRVTLLRLCRVDNVLARAAEPLGITIATLPALQRHGPFAPVFLRPGDPDTPVDILGRPA